MATRNDPSGDIPRPNIPPAVSHSRPPKQRSDDFDIKQICTTNQRSPPDGVSGRSHRYLGVAQPRDHRSGVVADDLYRRSVVPFGAAEQLLHCDSDRRLPCRSRPGVVPAASRKQGRTASRDPVLTFARSTARPGRARHRSDRKCRIPLQSAQRRTLVVVAAEMLVVERKQVPGWSTRAVTSQRKMTDVAGADPLSRAETRLSRSLSASGILALTCPGSL
jgi:hypothetical protein